MATPSKYWEIVRQLKVQNKHSNDGQYRRTEIVHFYGDDYDMNFKAILESNDGGRHWICNIIINEYQVPLDLIECFAKANRLEWCIKEEDVLVKYS